MNALWDLGERAGKPLWQLLADITPEQLVDLRRLPLPHRRARRRDEALELLRGEAPARPSASES